MSFNVDGGTTKERLTTAEFLDLIPHLSFKEVLKVEVFIHSWKPLLKPDKVKGYQCTICDCFQSNPKNLMAHINGKRHNSFMKGVKEIYQPDYTYPKSTDKNKEKPKEAETTAKKTVFETKNNEKMDTSNTATSSSPSKDKNIVKNPFCSKRPSENITATVSDSTDIPEVIIIDDNDDVVVIDNSPEKSAQKNDAKNDEQPPTKKPKIMVASMASLTGRPAPEDDKDKDSVAANDLVQKVDTESEKNKIHGFVGVEYVVKIVRAGAATRYECGLCELALSFDDMQNHLLGYSHRLKFCEKHFPTAIQQFRQYIVDVPSDE